MHVSLNAIKQGFEVLVNKISNCFCQDQCCQFFRLSACDVCKDKEYFKGACLQGNILNKLVLLLGDILNKLVFLQGNILNKLVFCAGLCEVELGSLDPVSGARLRSTVCLILQESLLTLESALAQGGQRAQHRAQHMVRFYQPSLALSCYVFHIVQQLFFTEQGIFCVMAPSFSRSSLFLLNGPNNLKEARQDPDPAGPVPNQLASWNRNYGSAGPDP